MKRIFFAVRVDPGEKMMEIISELKKLMSEENIRWVEPSNFHITLAFPGNTEEDKIAAATYLVNDYCKASGEFKFSISGTGVFKSLRDPKVIWMGVSESERLKNLYVLVTSALKSMELKIEERAFNPHVTIGRIKSVSFPEKFTADIEKYQNLIIQEVSVKEVILYESILKPTGPVYNPLSKIKLGS